MRKDQLRKVVERSWRSTFGFILLMILIIGVEGRVLAADLPGSEGANSGAIRYAVKGYISDALTGEMLIGATVYVDEIQSGATSNVYGFYSLSLPEGTYTVRYTFVGYTTVVKKITLSGGLNLNVAMEPSATQLGTVEIKGEEIVQDVKRAEMSVVKMDIKQVRTIPALMGEVDIIKALQLLPGVQVAAEGTNGFSVRGGGLDQNLILLDEATVYNASHFMGFFSVFNNDAIKDVQIYKGDIPASSGGRLSSLVDVRMKDGNLKKFSATGGIGTISSRLTIEGPILKDRTSFILSGRRTYADIFLPLSSDKSVRDNTLYFYDLNAKVQHEINEHNRIFVSGYFGRDVFENKFANMNFGNQTFTTRWNHLFSDKLFSNFTGIISKYDYSIGTPDGKANSFLWESSMKDYSFKGDFSWFPHPENTVRFGVSTVWHEFNPGYVRGTGESTVFKELRLPLAHALESAIYASHEVQFLGRFNLKYGLRLSVFQNVGKSTVYQYDNKYEVADSSVYGSGDFYKTFMRLEPRLALTYSLTESSSVKASYSRTSQYLQLAQNSTAGTPLDVWFSSSPNVKPQMADQVAVGYFRNFSSSEYEFSAEAYYKWMSNTLDFKDNADIFFNKYLESELRVGKSWSYGFELLLRRNSGKLTGWVGYTFSVARRQIDEINEGVAYKAPYDKPHNITVVASYAFSPRYQFSANWVYSTGAPVTFPTGRAIIGNEVVPVYTARNEYRMPDYHRLDVSFIIKRKQHPNMKWDWEWNFSIYNLYGRKNAWSIGFVEEEDNPGVTYAEKTYLFGMVPSVTFNFKF
ncbi:MAG: TonB-dependent receptor [Sphingobacteriia bacterium]|nr:TonB-dependent receptor [Sphingobacteriia bacterium]